LRIWRRSGLVVPCRRELCNGPFNAVDACDESGRVYEVAMGDVACSVRSVFWSCR
jgi:hypothetical protein